MIKVRIEKDGCSHMVSVKDHGRSDVCVAVSALTTTLYCSLTNNKHFTKTLKGSLASGESWVVCDAKVENAKEVSLIFETIIYGYLMLANDYPADIEVVRCGW